MSINKPFLPGKKNTIPALACAIFAVSPALGSSPAGDAGATQTDGLSLAVAPREVAFGEREFNRQRVDTYLAQVRAQEISGSTYSPLLGESVLGMARSLHNAGEYVRALEAYQRAMHISRVNNGIYSLSQEPMIRGMIETYQAVGDPISASRQYQDLYRIYAGTYGNDDPHLLPVLEEISEWHIRAYARQPQREGLFHLVSSHNFTENALNLAAVSPSSSEVRVLPLLHNMVTINYLLALHHQQFPGGSGESFRFTTTSADGFPEPPSREETLMINSYRNGRSAHEQIIDIVFNDPDSTPRQKADALAELGDWYLLFGRYSSARQAYEDGWKTLAEAGVPEHKLDELFGQPRMLQPVAGIDDRGGVSAPSEYARVVMTITDRGNADEIQVLETHPSDDKGLARTAVRTLKYSKFRPRLEHGQVVATKEVPLKLYLTEAQ
jgi:tetratricopeptide (TPR) repeat protein